jgi:hypothetical protein
VPFSQHVPLAGFAWACFSLAILLLRNVYGPPILLLVALLQLAQAGAVLFQASLRGVAIQELPGNGPWIENAIWFALASILILSLGMRLGSGMGRKRPATADDDQLTPDGALRFYAACYAASGAAMILGRLIGGSAAQLTLQLSGIRWVGLFVLFYICLRPGGRPLYAVAVLALEVAIGFTGFFASFKEVFYLAVMAALISGARFTFVRAVAISGSAALLIALMAFWSAIKVDYREFLNRGSGEQVVVQNLGDRFDYLVDQALNADARLFQYGLVRLLDRVSYVYYLGRTIEHVPASVPHEGGALLGNALVHIATPRLFFPDKPPLPSDTVVTAKYANMGAHYVHMAGQTSISIGYLGELYIDFGFAGAMLCCGILGLIYGRMHRTLCNYPALPTVLNHGLSVMVLLNAVQFEQALIKTLGSVVAAFIVALLLRRYVLPWLYVMSTEIGMLVGGEERDAAPAARK